MFEKELSPAADFQKVGEDGQLAFPAFLVRLFESCGDLVLFCFQLIRASLPPYEGREFARTVRWHTWREQICTHASGDRSMRKLLQGCCRDRSGRSSFVKGGSSVWGHPMVCV